MSILQIQRQVLYDFSFQQILKDSDLLQNEHILIFFRF